MNRNTPLNQKNVSDKLHFYKQSALLFGCLLSGSMLVSNDASANNTLLQTDLSTTSINLQISKQPVAEKPFFKMIATQKLSAQLTVGKNQSKLNGRLSFSLSSSEKQFSQGIVTASGFNLVYFDVPQEKITGVKPRGKDTGALGFRINAGQDAVLKYDAKSNSIYGTLSGVIDLPQFEELGKNYARKGDHDFMWSVQNAKVSIKIQLTEALNLAAAETDVARVSGDISISMEADRDNTLNLNNYRLDIAQTPIIIDYTIYAYFESAQKLCIQPVRVGRYIFNYWPSFSFNYVTSGDGLNFGMPGARTQWAKADVVFNVRSWKTVNNSSYSTLTESEASGLRGTVNDDDCIEVFFVDRLSPSDTWGGGATWGGGLASSKIISSDENADNGIDLTHLAHELGHTLTLKHPGQGYPTASYPYRYDGTSGTLMCPSGFMNDNPAINSQNNKNNIQNPLLTYTFKLISAGPDCTNDANCGACP